MLQALLLGLIAFVAQSEFALGTSLISRPIVTGLFTGLVMGDIKAGLIAAMNAHNSSIDLGL